jgi:hypothetical protein
MLSNLLKAESRLVAHLEPLPFQEGRPLATVAEGSTELVDESSHELSSRQVLMAEEGEDGGDLPIDNFDVISEDEITANAGNENDADREVRRARNRARTIRQRRANERRRSMHHELDPEFAAVSERGFRTPVANITRVTAILERSHGPEVRQALLYAQRAWIQLDQHNSASIIREERVDESRSQAHSRTAGGRPQHQISNDNARGSQAPGGRQQPLQGGHLRQACRRSPRLRLTPRHIEFRRDLRWSHATAVALFPTQSIRSTGLHLVRWNGSHKELHRLHPEWLHSEQSCFCQKRMASSRRCPHLLLASLIRPSGSYLAYGARSQRERSSTTLRGILLGVVPFLLYARQPRDDARVLS